MKQILTYLPLNLLILMQTIDTFYSSDDLHDKKMITLYIFTESELIHFHSPSPNLVTHS